MFNILGLRVFWGFFLPRINDKHIFGLRGLKSSRNLNLSSEVKCTANCYAAFLIEVSRATDRSVNY